MVAQPGHGSMTLNVDGSFIYTPDANYFGSDSFTCRSTTALDSNVATVTITVDARSTTRRSRRTTSTTSDEDDDHRPAR